MSESIPLWYHLILHASAHTMSRNRSMGYQGVMHGQLSEGCGLTLDAGLRLSIPDLNLFRTLESQVRRKRPESR